ncbi:cytochrome-c oxidase, cbb3-type subunit III [Propylenella binzhouense]|uniref:Cbb3-type cytochrome c oxidase subunit n=1 Tax=Propylenella binzhouense TaxID=2555902 RepID=A0A964T580_9HYPH|nr:cytochrome-c oxidase, cbb3-type subunit III [Propylenella binzhouense]MYZ48743.1 cytochrome-c oxidase, cbb3-type subunit III [Propylenella binzhouense]
MADIKQPHTGGPQGVERDEPTGQITTGHEWDGIKELDTPMPRWWLWTFYGTIVWALGYVILYPAWPLVHDATRGVLGWSSRGQVQEALVEAAQAQGGFRDRIASLSLEDIRQDPELLRFAQAGGRSAFQVNCSQCHGSGAAGSVGYPNLNDDEWLWGGTLEEIHATIVNGARFVGNDDTHVSEMPAFGDGVLDRAQIEQVANYVLSLSGSPHDAAKAEAGAPLFADNCAACHGDAGQGDASVGAPALNDQIWLYSGKLDAIVAQIQRPRHGVMPAWGHRLDPTTIKELALYVHGLGGGK